MKNTTEYDSSLCAWALVGAVPEAEHLFGSTQWAHVWHYGFHWAQIHPSECVHSWSDLGKSRARQQERTKPKAVKWQRVVVLSLMRTHNIAGDSPEAIAQPYQCTHQDINTNKTPSKGGDWGNKWRCWGASTPASNLTANQEIWVLFNQNSTQRETAKQNL